MSNKLGVYLDFLQSPSTGALSGDASINYITTTTTVSEPTAILKHLGAQAKQVDKKEQKVLYTIEADNGVCLETLTTLRFRMGGGAYLPEMDSNMLDEREVTFPLTHVVTYKDGMIQQIRLYWDQGTLLKQIEAIGKTGRNWPIREGKAQVDTVAASINSGMQGGRSAAQEPPGVRNANEVVIRGHHKRESVSVTRDPHASLALFAERDVNEDGRTYNGPKYEPVKSAKPVPRDIGELFTHESSARNACGSQSPHKMEGTVLKAGAGRNHQNNRLFDEDEEQEAPRSPERKKTYSQKYEHFAFGNGEDAPKEKGPANKNQGQRSATFSFEDFSTPPKHIEKNRPDYERHWGAGVDEVRENLYTKMLFGDDEDTTDLMQSDPESPPKRPVVHQPRKDAEPHWETTHEASPAPSKMKSLQRQKGLGLYGDPLHKDERVSKAQKPNVNNARRGDDFGPHYEISDKSPAGPKPAQKKGTTRSDMDSHWSFDSPAREEKKIYKTAGDGMGSRAGRRAWGIGDVADLAVPNKRVREPSRTSEFPLDRARERESEQVARTAREPGRAASPTKRPCVENTQEDEVEGFEAPHGTAQTPAVGDDNDEVDVRDDPTSDHGTMI